MQCIRILPTMLVIATASFVSAQALPAADNSPAQTSAPVSIPQQVGASEAVQPTIVAAEQTPTPLPDSASPRETGDLTVAELQLVQDTTDDARRIAQVAELAKTRCSDSKVASYAAQLLKKDTSIIRSMEDMGRQNGLMMEIGNEPSSVDDNPAASLAALEGTQFDRSFVQQALSDHEELMARLQTAQKDVINPDLQKLVSKSVSTLKNLNEDAVKLGK